MTPHLASLGAVSVPRRTYVSLLSGALGGGTAGSVVGAGVGSGSVVGDVSLRASGAGEAPRPDLLALERLLDATGAAGAPGPAGYVIAQLLGQTS